MTPAATREEKADGRDARWDEHRQNRHERILTTAIAMIDAGNGDAGVATIAAEAGVPRSVVYRLFKDREDLDEQIRQRIVESMVADLAPALVVRGTIRAAVRRAVTTYVEWVQEHAEPAPLPRLRLRQPPRARLARDVRRQGRVRADGDRDHRGPAGAHERAAQGAARAGRRPRHRSGRDDRQRRQRLAERQPRHPQQRRRAEPLPDRGRLWADPRRGRPRQGSTSTWTGRCPADPSFRGGRRDRRGSRVVCVTTPECPEAARVRPLQRQ
ncbi:TetR/AcrR family transcriptional regulator [Nocardioides sp. W3-2-3]|uniref:TetR/AcrR family transcriptional regulator n=1 Tax=Nocardioides convexus TaxID=2712224 RepID=UPI0024185759|nr:TetR/AcrR family transcriptional regulator [Nocardioides convexus]NGZ99437.1 TetR/AcrR family transcriptional regulator [Nocardioides convexus]